MTSLLRQEELYWSQKAGLQWLRQGERNTRFFHTSVEARRRRNQIRQLKNESGQWCTNDHDLECIAIRFYNDLYTRDTSTVISTEAWNFPRLPRASLRWVNRDVTDCEIKTAMFQLGANKAPGPDGIPASFFQKHWNWVGPSVVKFIRAVFSTGTIPESMNQFLICLLPKQSPREPLPSFDRFA